MRLMLVLIIINFLGCSVSKKEKIEEVCFAEEKLNELKETSFNDLENISSLQNKTIKMRGVFSFNFENIALYPNSHFNSSDAVWLYFSDDVIKHDSLLRKMNGADVTVIGRIDFLKKGHANQFLATLDSVFCIKRE